MTGVEERSSLFERLPLPERRFIVEALRQETVGGALLLLAATAAMIIANSPWVDGYEALRATVVGPPALHLDLSLEKWASDGLLAIFFFIAGLELKRELVVGTLREPAAAAVPIGAAVAGMVVPAAVYLAVTWSDPSARAGWAIPAATDIAFALAVLAVLGSRLPASVRAFLLTLAIVDDMGAILIIAIFYTSALHLLPLAAAALGLGFYAWLQHRRVTSAWLYVPLAFTIWALVHASGVHATIAGVAMGLLTRVRPDPGEDHSPAERLEHRLRPLSAGVAVPVFAFLSAGVPLATGLGPVFADAAAVGVIVGLVVGKCLGVLVGTFGVARLTRTPIPKDRRGDVLAVSLLGGIGFTVSLLIAELAFEDDPTRLDHVKAAILIGSGISAVLAGLVLTWRSRHYRAVFHLEERDTDGDGVPDVYQTATITDRLAPPTDP